MHFNSHGKFVRTDIWREGEWVDLWSVVHFLSGSSVGFSLYIIGFDALSASVIATILLIAYEMWEAMVRIEETRANRVMDVVVGLASFFPTYFYLAPTLAGEELYAVFAAILALNIILSVFGWMASRKAAAFEARMRLEYEMKRESVRRRLRTMRERRMNRKLKEE